MKRFLGFTRYDNNVYRKSEKENGINVFWQAGLWYNEPTTQNLMSENKEYRRDTNGTV